MLAVSQMKLKRCWYSNKVIKEAESVLSIGSSDLPVHLSETSKVVGAAHPFVGTSSVAKHGKK